MTELCVCVSQLNELKKTINSTKTDLEKAQERATTATSQEQQAIQDRKEQVSVCLCVSFSECVFMCWEGYSL